MDNRKINLVRRDIIVGSKRLSNYFWAIVLFLGGTGFLLAGFSSYFKVNLLPFANPTELVFIPQGIVMTFYGVVAICLSLYITLTIFWDIGGGYNEFNKADDLIRIARNGFPGKNRRIDLSYSIDDVKAIRVELKDGINPKRTIYLCIKGQRQIPLTPVGQPLTLEEIEMQAAELAQFLQKDLLLN